MDKEKLKQRLNQISITFVFLLVLSIIIYESLRPESAAINLFILSAFVIVSILVFKKFMSLKKLKESLPAEFKEIKPPEASQPLNSVVKAIEEFKPMKRWKDEKKYQLELARFLEDKIGNVKLEQGAGSGRVDLTVGFNNEIGIEIKSLFNKVQLDRLTGQCLDYCKLYANLIVVIFNEQVPLEEVNDFKDNLKTELKPEYYNKISVIIK